MNWRVVLLLACVLATVIILFLFPAIPQSEAYHNFADRRALLGIPNCLDVLSNLPFLLVGTMGISFVFRSREDNQHFVDSRERWTYFAFFTGVALTAFGSSYYHLRPDDNTLVWDRIPMAIGFTALVAATVAERISVKWGFSLWAPLLLLGAGSVLYWHITQSRGAGDLRPYAFAQFGSLLVISLMLALFAPRYTRGSDFVVSLAIYGGAKLFEATDRAVFSLAGIVSGHTIKHLVAALSTWWILRMLMLREPLPSSSSSA